MSPLDALYEIIAIQLICSPVTKTITKDRIRHTNTVKINVWEETLKAKLNFKFVKKENSTRHL